MPKSKGKADTLMSIDVEGAIKEIFQLHSVGAQDELVKHCNKYLPFFNKLRFNFYKTPPTGYRLFLHFRSLQLAALPKEERIFAEIPLWRNLDDEQKAQYESRAKKISFLQSAVCNVLDGSTQFLQTIDKSLIKMYTTGATLLDTPVSREPCKSKSRRSRKRHLESEDDSDDSDYLVTCNPPRRPTAPLPSINNDLIPYNPRRRPSASDPLPTINNDLIPYNPRKRPSAPVARINSYSVPYNRPRRLSAPLPSINEADEVDCLRLRNRSLERPKRHITSSKVVEVEKTDKPVVLARRKRAPKPKEKPIPVPSDTSSDEVEILAEVPKVAAEEEIVIANNDTALAILPSHSEPEEMAPSQSSAVAVENSLANPEPAKSYEMVCFGNMFSVDITSMHDGYKMFDPPYSSNMWHFVQMKVHNVWTQLKKEKGVGSSDALAICGAQEDMTLSAIESEQNSSSLPELQYSECETQTIQQDTVPFLNMGPGDIEVSCHPLEENANWNVGHHDESGEMILPSNNFDQDMLYSNEFRIIETQETTAYFEEGDVSLGSANTSHDLKCFEKMVDTTLSDASDGLSRGVQFGVMVAEDSDIDDEFRGFGELVPSLPVKVVKEPSSQQLIGNKNAEKDQNGYSILNEQLPTFDPLIEEMLYFNTSTDFIRELGYLRQ